MVTNSFDFVVRHGYTLVFFWILAEQAALPVPSAPLLLAAVFATWIARELIQRRRFVKKLAITRDRDVVLCCSCPNEVSKARHAVRNAVPLLVLLGLFLALPACTSTVKVRSVRSEDTYRWVQRAMPASDEPSAGTLELLRLHGLGRVWRAHPWAALQGIEDAHETGLTARFAAVELTLLAARRAADEKTGGRLDLYLATAARSWDYLFDRRPGDPEPGFDQDYGSAVMIYADAVARVVETLANAHGARKATTAITVRGPAGPFELTFGRGDWRFDQLKTLLAVDRFAVEGLPDRFIRYGLGAPFAGLAGQDPSAPASAFYPPKGLGIPVTALLRFAAAPADRSATRRADVELLDPGTRESVEIAGEAIPVAADFTAAYGHLAAIGEREIREIGSKGMFSPSATGSFHRMILMEPYDPDKTPLVFVHGLWSDPSIWLPLTNRIEGDPELQRTYQVWYFIYPSGEPFLWTAAMFRDAIDEVRHRLDPLGRDAAMRSMVLVGHSMGGVLVKTTVAASGDTLWNTIFTVPPAGLAVPAPQLTALENALFFTPKPYVRRVIFLATAQRGCRMAKSLMGRIASALIKLPKPFSDMLRSIARNQPDAVAPAMRSLLRRGGADAVRVLRPDNPVMRAFAAIPIAPGVPYHTILGDRGKGGGEDASDGVVSYRSGHLDGAASETIVPCGHHDAACPAAMNEVLRILREDVASRREGAMPHRPLPAQLSRDKDTRAPAP